MLEQPVTIYEAIPEPTAETTITEVVLGAVSVVLGVAGVALVLGLIIAGILIGIRRMRRTKQVDDDEGDAHVTRLGLNSSQRPGPN